MYVFITIIIVIVCVLLVLIVLVQNSKGGGLAANFSGSTQVMGVRKTADFLEKATWSFATALLVLSIISSVFVEKNANIKKPRTEGQISTEQTVPQQNIPAMPADHPFAQEKQGEK